MIKPSIFYIIRGYPQISKTYVQRELEAIYDDYKVTIVSKHTVNIAYEEHYPYQYMTEQDAIQELIAQVKPDVLHTHYLNQLDFVGSIAEATGVPFTVRSHSFDTMILRPMGWRGTIRKILERNTPQFKKLSNIKHSLQWANHDLCLGVLAFPFARPYLEAHGVRSEKIIDCFPVVSYDRFYNRAPNGNNVMNTGAAIPKKKMSDYLDLASSMPNKIFNLYAMGYRVNELETLNRKMNNPVNIIEAIEPNRMPAEYKKHQWLVYTADFELAMVGWPMAIAEAQASGVGVCMPKIRPDLEQYVGDAGILYESISEVRDIIAQPVSQEMREAGFEQAKKSDIQRHKRLLTDLWDKAAQKKLAKIA